MTTWFTADQHFGHANIIKHCNRPFATAAEMDDALVRRWNQTVAPADAVWVLGDVALSTKNLGRIRELHGRKILVAGNHDACWDGHKRWRKYVDAYLAAGFDNVVTSGLLRERTLGTDLLVDLAHLPYAGDSHPEDRYADRRPGNHGRVLLCGHVHEAWKISGRQINVGVDVWDYRPVAEETLRDLIIEKLLAPAETARP